MRLIVIKNWEKFQHYHDRRPPWVKLYTSLLDDLEYLGMSDRAQLHLIKLWLLAARLGHPLPAKPALLAGKIGVKSVALKELLSAGFISEVDASEQPPEDASEVLDSHARARAGERADAPSREVEGEGDSSTTTAPAGDGHVENFREPGHRTAYVGYRRAALVPDAFDRAIAQIADPLGGNGFGWAVLGQALAEAAANSVPFNVSAIKGYCRRIVTPPPARRGEAVPAAPDKAIPPGFQRNPNGAGLVRIAS